MLHCQAALSITTYKQVINNCFIFVKYSFYGWLDYVNYTNLTHNLSRNYTYRLLLPNKSIYFSVKFQRAVFGVVAHQEHHSETVEKLLKSVLKWCFPHKTLFQRFFFFFFFFYSKIRSLSPTTATNVAGRMQNLRPWWYK